MTKLSVLSLALLSFSATSAFHVPNNNQQPIVISQQLTNAATTAAIALTTSPLMALAEQDDDYVYGAVAVRMVMYCTLRFSNKWYSQMQQVASAFNCRTLIPTPDRK